MKHKHISFENKQAISRGQKVYRMLFGEPDKKPLVGVREFTIGHLFANVWSRSCPPLIKTKMITFKERSMITVALLASQGRDEELETHIKGALHLGISKEQLLEIMIHVAHYAGWPAGNNGQSILMRLCTEEEEWKHVEAHKGKTRNQRGEFHKHSRRRVAPGG